MVLCSLRGSCVLVKQVCLNLVLKLGVCYYANVMFVIHLLMCRYRLVIVINTYLLANCIYPAWVATPNFVTVPGYRGVVSFASRLFPVTYNLSLLYYYTCSYLIGVHCFR